MAAVDVPAARRWSDRGNLSVLIFGALGLRVAMASRSGLWRDETLFLDTVDASTVWELPGFLRHGSIHPPLFYLMMRAWRDLFGASEAAALALPILLGVALVPVIALVGSQVYSRRAGWIAALLVASSPVLAANSALVRPYSLLPLLGLLSVFFLWRSLERGGADSWSAHGLATLALILTHHWGLLVLLAEGMVVAVAIGSRPGLRSSGRISAWLLTLAAIAGGYAAWLPSMLDQLDHGKVWQPMAIRDVIGCFARKIVDHRLPLAGLIGGLIALAAWIVRRRRHAGRVVVGLDLGLFLGVPLVAFALAAALTSFTYLLASRNLATVLPCGLVAVASGIALLGTGSRPALPVLITAGLVGADLAGAFFMPIKSNAREVAAILRARALPGDLLVFAPNYVSQSFNFYYRSSQPQIYYRLEASPREKAEIDARLVEARRLGRRVWLILDRDRLERGADLNPLRDRLSGLYGPPDTNVIAPARRPAHETLVAFRYEGPEPPSSDRAGDP